MDFVYDMLEKAKNKVHAACNRKELTFRPIIEIVQKHAKG